MATGTDPLQREQIGLVSHDTGDRLEAPRSNAALRLAASLGDIVPTVAVVGQQVGQELKQDTEQNARRDALSASGAQLADAVRLGKIKPTQNPWYIDAYNRESGAIRGTDALSQLQTDSASWAEKNDPVAFANKWHQEVGKLAGQFGGDPETFAGFNAAQDQATQQTLATNQAYNSHRIETDRMQNLGSLAADAVQRVVQGNGGVASGSQIASALQPAKAQWIATGGSIDDWNKLAISAVTTASYYLRSPHLLNALKDPALINGPQPNDTSQYGDGVDDQKPDPPKALTVVPGAPAAQGPAVTSGPRLAQPVTGPITNTFAQHVARGSHGVDIAVPIGTKVMSPVGGVAQVGQDPKAGLFVRVVSPDGKVISSYAHLSVAQVQNGQQVAPGQIVARSGSSGDATGPHVHWRLKVDGQDVDPLAYHPGDQQQAAAAPATNAVQGTPDLAPAPAAPPTAQPPVTVLGQSLYDQPGVADAVESDRYRITQGLKTEATDRLQAILAQRKIDGLSASDRLYSTFGTKLLTGAVDTNTIVNTLSKAGYSGPVIAEALNNIHSGVADSEGIQQARFALNSDTPATGKQILDLATEGRVNGYSPEYEHKVASAVINGTIKADDAISMVSGSVSRSEQIQSQARAQQSFQEAHPPGQPGQIIRKASQVKAGIDQYVTLTSSRASALLGKNLSKGALANQQSKIKGIVVDHLVDFPGDYAGAETLVRNYIAQVLKGLAASKGQPIQTSTSSPAPAGSNPRR